MLLLVMCSLLKPLLVTRHTRTDIAMPTVVQWRKDHFPFSLWTNRVKGRATSQLDLSVLTCQQAFCLSDVWQPPFKKTIGWLNWAWWNASDSKSSWNISYGAQHVPWRREVKNKNKNKQKSLAASYCNHLCDWASGQVPLSWGRTSTKGKKTLYRFLILALLW